METDKLNEVNGYTVTAFMWFGKMVRLNDERALDIYLALLRAYDGNARAVVPLDYAALARDIGLGTWPREAYRRQINKTLRKLQERYGLIEMRWGDAVKLYARPQSGRLGIPATYWDYGWSRSLSLAGKAMLLLCFAYSPVGLRARRWKVSRDTLVRRHHLSNWIVSRGTMELRRKNLLDVEYGPLGRWGQKPRSSHTLLPQPLYDPKVLARRLKRLEKKYGTAKLEKAKKLAALVYEDCDVGAMEALIRLEEQYGARVMRQAARIIAAKSGANPKRCVGYLIGTVRGLGDGAIFFSPGMADKQ